MINVSRAFTWSRLLAEAIALERLVNLGQRTACEKLAHPLCELSLRANSVGLCANGRCPLPLTRIGLANTTGISIVHVNAPCRSSGAAGWFRGELRIRDLPRPRKTAQFDGAYLRLGQPEQQLGAQEARRESRAGGPLGRHSPLPPEAAPVGPKRWRQGRVPLGRGKTKALSRG